MKNARRFFALLFAAALLALPKTAAACAVCMGASDSNVAPAINAAIFLMLGFVGTILTGVVGFIFYLARRAKNVTHEQDLALMMQGAQEGVL